MVRQAEIVVTGEINHLPAIEARDGFAGRLEHAQALVGAGLAPGLELLGEVSEGVRSGHYLDRSPGSAEANKLSPLLQAVVFHIRHRNQLTHFEQPGARPHPNALLEKK